MTCPLPPMRLTGATVLRDGVLQDRSLAIAGGRIGAGPYPAVDLSGYWILPGIVDLHGDAFERHIAARPGRDPDLAEALAATDREAAAAGVTTAWLAQGWSWEGGPRSPDLAEALLQALDLYRPEALTDLRVQLRYETHEHDSADRLLAAVRRHGVDYVVFNNHLGEAMLLRDVAPSDFAMRAARHGRSAEDHWHLVAQARNRAREVPRRLCRMAEAFDSLGVVYGSHDDPDGDTRETFSMLGARVCECPTSFQAASVAKAVGDPVLMGAPNVARGGSRAGHVSALALIRAGKCDALVSDDSYPSLRQAAFALVDAGVADLAAAWSMISARPAEILGLADRGEIGPGKRADMVVVNKATRRIEATIAGGRIAYLAGAAAHRFVAGEAQVTGLAAE